MVILELESGLYEIGAEDKEEPRYYPAPWDPGVLLPSVTTVIGVIRNPYLGRWRGRVGNREADRISKATSEYGQEVHDYTAIMDMVQTGLGIVGNVSPDLQPQLEEYVEWRDTHVEEVIEVELLVVSRVYLYAGRLDRVFIMKGDKLPSVWDIKTGTLRGISGAQTAAYKHAYSEMTHKEVGRRGLIGVSRVTGRVSIKEHTDPGDFTGFLSLLYAYRWLERVGEV